MSGSLKWFKYTADNADVYHVLLDESNAELANFGFTAWTATDNTKPQPKGHRMRYVNASSVDGLTKRRLYVGTSTATAYTAASFKITDYDDNGTAVDLYVRSVRGERGAPRPFAGDSGKKDGDD
jgi:hypothetical protein